MRKRPDPAEDFPPLPGESLFHAFVWVGLTVCVALYALGCFLGVF